MQPVMFHRQPLCPHSSLANSHIGAISYASYYASHYKLYCRKVAKPKVLKALLFVTGLWTGWLTIGHFCLKPARKKRTELERATSSRPEVRRDRSGARGLRGHLFPSVSASSRE